MKILIIGATGTIGAAISTALGEQHEVLPAGRREKLHVDLNEPASLSILMAAHKNIDAIVSCAAHVPLIPLSDMTPDTARQMVAAKLFGQVELVRLAAVHLNANGSITLTSGSFQSPTLHSAMGAMANAGLESFVQAAALEMERGLRLNAVSPGWIAETLVKLGRDATEGAPVSDVVDCYLQAIDGSFSGRVLQPAPRNRMQ